MVGPRSSNGRVASISEGTQVAFETSVRLVGLPVGLRVPIHFPLERVSTDQAEHQGDGGENREVEHGQGDLRDDPADRPGGQRQANKGRLEPARAGQADDSEGHGQAP